MAVGLDGFGDHFPWQLSGGMQQRVAIARALAYQPSILLMDEPFASVDAQTRGDLEDLVLRVREEFGVTIVFVTHDIDESVYLSDRIVVLTHAPTEVKEIIPVGLPSPARPDRDEGARRLRAPARARLPADQERAGDAPLPRLAAAGGLIRSRAARRLTRRKGMTEDKRAAGERGSSDSRSRGCLRSWWSSAATAASAPAQAAGSRDDHGEHAPDRERASRWISGSRRASSPSRGSRSTSACSRAATTSCSPSRTATATSATSAGCPR